MVNRVKEKLPAELVCSLLGNQGNLPSRARSRLGFVIRLILRYTRKHFSCYGSFAFPEGEKQFFLIDESSLLGLLSFVFLTIDVHDQLGDFAFVVPNKFQLRIHMWRIELCLRQGHQLLF